MRHLYLLRHAKSSWSDSGADDIDRPLATRGVRAVERIAEHLRKTSITPALILCSPARRARQTLDAVALALGPEAEMRVEPALYGADEEELLQTIHGVPESVPSLMLVGHNPGLQDLALLLARGGTLRTRIEEKLPTGAFVTLAIDRRAWADLAQDGAEVVGFVVPRELGA